MSKNTVGNVLIFDTTLRDGEQSAGTAMTTVFLLDSTDIKRSTINLELVGQRTKVENAWEMMLLHLQY